MENSPPENYVRIENSKFGNRGIICMVSKLMISFVICAIIGATGPQVLQSRSDSVSTLELNDNGDATWIGSVDELIQLNQLFWLSVKVYRPTSLEDEIGVIETYVNVSGYSSLVDARDEMLFKNRHDKHSVYCSGDECSDFYLFGQSTITFRSYNVRIGFSDVDSKFIQAGGTLDVLVKFHTINSEYSKFELGWKIFFCLVTLLVLFTPREGFLFKLYFVPYSMWSFEQAWVAGLLISLFFFNDPFFPAQLYSQYANGFAILYIILTCSFLAVLLTFWLSLLDEVRLSPPSSSVRAATERRKRIYWLYGPKLVIVGCIWSILVSTFVFIRLERKGDPTYEGLDDWVLRDAEIALFAFILLYIVWLLVLLVLSFSKIMQLSPPFKFLFAGTVIVYGIVFTGLFAGYFYPLSTSAVVFLCFYATINFYVWALAFAFAPLGTDEGYRKAVTTFGEDYFDEHGSLQGGMDYADL